MFTDFPMGTFLANIVGTLCLGIFFIFRFAFDQKDFFFFFFVAVGDVFFGNF